MINVVLLGAGNVAFHLEKAFNNTKNINLVQHYRRNNTNDKDFNPLVPKTNNINKLANADIYIIAINDDEIGNLSKQIHIKKGLVVHTSGGQDLYALQCKTHKGVLYPLQTFSKSQKMDYNNITFCLETEFETDMILLQSFAKSMSSNVFEINSSQREKLHIAAVFANNFSNQMFYIAKNICESNNFSFDILKPIIKETATKIQTLDPFLAQTGPAKRNDQKVLEKHLAQLSGEQKEIYTLLSNSITKTHNK